MPLNKTAPFVSVIVPMRNEEPHIEKCIRSLIDQDYPTNLYEVLVVDGMSNDHSKKVAQAISDNYPNIFLLENPGILTSSGLNIGIRKSKGEIVIILGAHSFVQNDFISKNAEFIKKNEHHCVGGPIETLGETHNAKVISLAMSSAFGVGDALFRYGKSEAYVDTVAFGAYKKEVFEKIGLFDEELARNQDDEFNYRLRKAGGKIFITPEIKLSYYSRATLRKLWSQYFQYGFWKIRVLQKHPKMMRLRQLIPGVFVLSVILSFGLVFYHYIFGYLTLIILGSYVGCNLLSSLRIARKEGLKCLPLLPAAFSAMHFSYGMGFLIGLITFFPKWFQKEMDPPKLSDIKT